MTEADILYERGDFWVSRERDRRHPAGSFHVWRSGVTHSTVDSAYADMSLAKARVDYLAGRG